MLDGLGWLATAIFASSYFCKRPETLRRVQAAAALRWVGSGVLLGALPVVVAHLIVAAAAVFSARRRAAAEPQ